ncbi:hypothetical protein B0H19DRAFT_1077973 [Mycena capillaripes]|nr:hypothetical protein B0H19DRAFT_1077973 [Mycena capillaripes]
MAASSPEVDSLLEYARIAASTVNDVCGSDAHLRAVSGATMLVIPMIQEDVRANGERFYTFLPSQQELERLGDFSSKWKLTLSSKRRCKMFWFRLKFASVQFGAVSTIAASDTKRSLNFWRHTITQIFRHGVDGSIRVSILGSYLNNDRDAHSSGTLSLVPASPQIFHRRKSELEEVIRALMQQPARIAILGTGGMGKTALALATLHHPTVEQKYAQRHFVTCESANSAVELISIVGTHLGLEPSRQISRAIVQHFLDSGPTILVVHNMGTPWESLST